MPKLSAALLLTAALAVTLPSCGPSPVATPAVTAPVPGSPAAATPPASTATELPGSPSSPAGPNATDLPRNVALAPGRYTKSSFQPRITFEVEAGWQAIQALDGFFDIQQDVGSPDVIAVQFARPTGFYAAAGALVEPSTAAEAAAAIAANPALTIVDSSASAMSGLDGFVVEVENPSTASGPAQVLDVPPGALSIDPARRLWVAVFDTPEGIVAIMVGGSVANWDAALAAAEPVLETVTIGR